MTDINLETASKTGSRLSLLTKGEDEQCEQERRRSSRSNAKPEHRLGHGKGAGDVRESDDPRHATEPVSIAEEANDAYRCRGPEQS